MVAVRVATIGHPHHGSRNCCGQAMVHAAPLSVNAVGVAVLPVWLAWKPTLTDAFGAMAALYATFLAVTCPELGE